MTVTMSNSTDAGAWVDGYGVVAPDVARYAEVLRAVPDALALAMQHVAAVDEAPIVDADTATLVATLVRGRTDLRVVEVGTSVGFLTMHLARALDASAHLVSIDVEPTRQGHAHEFLSRVEYDCTLELRLGDPVRLVHATLREGPVDVLVLGDPDVDRVRLLDEATPDLAPDALVLVPHALRGGRVADSVRVWDDDDDVGAQRSLNRALATDPRYGDVALLPIGDGLLMARRL